MPIGRYPRFGDSHISGLRPQNWECNFGLSRFRENGKLPFLHKLHKLWAVKVAIWHIMVLYVAIFSLAKLY